MPGGGGVLLDLCHPRYVDAVAVRWPELTIISGRPAWPWQDEMISILLHKPNVWSELHGWSPRYLTDALKREIRSRLRKKVMFGGDYPLFRYFLAARTIDLTLGGATSQLIRLGEILAERPVA